MFGNLITNWHLKQLIEKKEIGIQPFLEKNLKSSHYTLHVGRIFTRTSEKKVKLVHSFKDDKDAEPYELKAGDYIIVEAHEQIRLMTDGIVGRFIAPSNFIESGLALVAGQISNKYGAEGEGIRFGLKNLIGDSILIDKTLRIAHLEFFDLRGTTMNPVYMSEDERRRWSSRRAHDDGVHYGDGS